ETRRSVRAFDTDRDVDMEIIDEALRIFQQTPSVCNRQAARLHIYRDRRKIIELLGIQAGSAAFRDRVPYLAAVTSDQRLFTGAGERNQSLIDGALAAMT